MEIREGVELPRIRTRGRPKGSGVNLRLLSSLRPGATVWNVRRKKMRSIIVSAAAAGIKLMVRRIPDTHFYAFKIVYAENPATEDSR